MLKYRVKHMISEIIFPLAYIITSWKMKKQRLYVYTDEETRRLVRGGVFCLPFRRWRNQYCNGKDLRH